MIECICTTPTNENKIMTVIIPWLPSRSEPRRRHLEKDGVLYEEVLPGDLEFTWKDHLRFGLQFAAVFILGVPILAAFIIWFMMPVLDYIDHHRAF